MKLGITTQNCMINRIITASKIYKMIITLASLVRYSEYKTEILDTQSGIKPKCNAPSVLFFEIILTPRPRARMSGNILKRTIDAVQFSFTTYVFQPFFY